MNMRFVIDETSWRFDDMTLDDCLTALDQLMDQIELAADQKHGVCYSEELFYQPVWREKSFYELLAPDSGFTISRDLNERLSILIHSLHTWQELDLPQPDTNQVHFNGQPQSAASIAWAHHQTKINKSNAVACLVLSPQRIGGSHDIAVANQNELIWLVADVGSYQGFFRWLITDASKNPNEMAHFSQSAFLNLDFRDHVFHGIKDMSKPYHAVVDDVVRHLAALSDYGREIFSQHFEDASNKFREFKVIMSPENGNTKQNKTAREQRTRQHHGKDVIFWWHSKLEVDRDRIHFYPNDVNNGGRILIGIFCRHLDT
jgi:hypothetical protein